MKKYLLIIISLLFTTMLMYNCTPKLEKSTVARVPKKAKAEILETPERTAAMNENNIEKQILSQKLPVDPAFRIGELENGMKYYIRKNKKPENRVELRLAVNAGSILEDDDQKGLAHFIEHMQFNGTEHFSKNSLIDYLEKTGTRFGADLNAYTSFDQTVYMLQLRSDEPGQLDTGLLVMFDWAGRATLDPEEIDKERGVVISEWRTRLSPEQRMMKKYLPVILKGSRYAERLPIGDPEIIKNAPYSTIRRFYKDWYRPDLMALVIVGDVDVDAMEKKVKEMFAVNKNPNPERPRAKYSIPPQPGTDIVIVTDKEAPFTNVQIMNKLPEKKILTYKDLMFDIEADLYNMMLNARLEEIKNRPDPPFTYAYTGYGGYLGDLDAYTSWAMVPEDKITDAVKTFAEENERVLRYGFTPSEFKRQKINLMKRAEKNKNEKDKTPSARHAIKAVYHYLSQSPMLSADQYYNFLKLHLKEIKLSDINKLAKNWIKDDNRVVLIKAPEKESIKLPTEQEVLNILANVKTADIKPYVDNEVKEPLFDKELPLAPIIKTENFDKYGVKKIVLGNGATVYLKKTDFKNDEVLFSAFSRGGTSLYEDKDFKNAHFAADAVEEMGLKDLDNTQLEKLLTGKNVSVSPYIYSLSEGMRGQTSVNDLETMFQLINLYFTQPRKDEKGFNSFKARNIGLYTNLLKNPQYYFYNLTNKLSHKPNPRIMGIPTAEDFEGLDMDRMYDIYKERFADAGDFIFIFVGNFDEDKILPLIQKYIGNLPSANKKEKWIDRHIEFKDGVVKETVHYGKAPKTFVSIKFHGDFDYNKDNEFVFKSMVKALDIRLREKLREDMGGVYGVRVYGTAKNEPREEYVISISFNSDPARTEELVKAVYDEIQKLATEGPDEELMQKIKEIPKQQRIKNLKENRYWLNKLNEITQDNLSMDEISLERLEQRINKLTAEDIKNAAKKYLNSNSVIEIKMYPEEDNK